MMKSKIYSTIIKKEKSNPIIADFKIIWFYMSKKTEEKYKSDGKYNASLEKFPSWFKLYGWKNKIVNNKYLSTLLRKFIFNFKNSQKTITQTNEVKN